MGRRRLKPGGTVTAMRPAAPPRRARRRRGLPRPRHRLPRIVVPLALATGCAGVLLWFTVVQVDALLARHSKPAVLMTEVCTELRALLVAQEGVLAEQLAIGRAQCDQTIPARFAELAELKLHTRLLTALLPARKRAQLADTPRPEPLGP